MSGTPQWHWDSSCHSSLLEMNAGAVVNATVRPPRCVKQLSSRDCVGACQHRSLRRRHCWRDCVMHGMHRAGSAVPLGGKATLQGSAAWRIWGLRGYRVIIAFRLGEGAPPNEACN